jgi:tetratricopeptide (TPR) repeat protein
MGPRRRRGEGARAVAELGLALALVAAVAPSPAWALDREVAMSAARALVREGKLDQARAAFAELAAADARDDEALLGLARIDAWQGKYAEARAAMEGIVLRHPTDDDARSALIDVLTWSGDLARANTVLEEGLARTPHSASLWVRKSRAEARAGRAGAAQAAASRAESLAPSDPDVRAERDRRFTGEVRLTGRVEVYTEGLPTLPGGELEVSQQVWRLRMGLRTEHRASLSNLAGGSAYNALHAASLALAFDGGGSVGVELGFGLPATALPRFQLAAHLEGPFARRFAGRLGYAFRYYPTDVGVHLAAPSLEWSPSDVVTLTARGWVGVVANPDAAVAAGVERVQPVYAGGAGAAFSPAPRISFGFNYSYGAQLELIPEAFQVATVRSHVADAFVDWQAARWFGLRPAYRFEARSTGAFDYLVNAFELGTYFRW